MFYVDCVHCAYGIFSYILIYVMYSQTHGCSCWYLLMLRLQIYVRNSRQTVTSLQRTAKQSIFIYLISFLLQL